MHSLQNFAIHSHRTTEEISRKTARRGRFRHVLTAAAIAVAISAPAAFAQDAAKSAADEGIPVSDALVVSKCGTCHRKDDKGNLTRISYVRATPEGWEEAIKRMVRLNGVKLEPTEARSILKYLSTYHGLAPEEAKPVMYMPEHRLRDEEIPNETVRGTCMTCHALGKAFQWRRTRDDWKLLTNMHVAFYAQADVAFRRAGAPNPAPGAAAPAANAKLPVEDTLDFLGKSYGLHSPEWANWQARMRAPKLVGRWAIAAHVTGKGKYVGEMVIAQGAAEDEFTTRIKMQSLKDGSKLERTGSGLVYAGYAWRGRSKAAAVPANTSPYDLNREMREALWISPDQAYAEGRWFWGEYQEFGVDVKLTRITADPMLITADRSSIKSGSTSQRVKLVGENIPADAAAADLDFGSGIKVKALVSHSATELVADVDVAANAVPGKRDVAFRRAVLPGAVAVYDRVDYLQVVPESTIARLGSDVHPKGYQQFEAIGYQRGADGKLHTADDVELGVIDASFSMEEFLAVYGDDDKEFIGSLSNDGFFTPSLDGPNPQRKFSRNNYGDVWVVATAKNEKDKDGKAISGKSYLVVTVPSYIRWDQPEVAP
ncbi:MAG: quinohemoprotein amine dehydrogenase subunit alpha [Bryobacteraceae bacterium]